MELLMVIPLLLYWGCTVVYPLFISLMIGSKKVLNCIIRKYIYWDDGIDS